MNRSMALMQLKSTVDFNILDMYSWWALVDTFTSAPGPKVKFSSEEHPEALMVIFHVVQTHSLDQADSGRLYWDRLFDMLHQKNLLPHLQFLQRIRLHLEQFPAGLCIV